MKKAAETGDVDAIMALCAQNPRLVVERLDDDGRSALYMAAWKGHPKGTEQ